MLNDAPVNNSKLIKLFCSLKKKEVKLFELWLNSPLHNQSEVNKRLFTTIKAHPNFQKDLPKSVLIAAIENKNKKEGKLQPEDEQKLRKAMTKLSSQIERFLEWQAWNNKPNVAKRELSDLLMSRKLYKLIPKQIKYIKARLNKQKQKSHQYNFELFLLKEMNFYLHIIFKNRNLDDDLQGLMDSLRHFFLGKILLYHAAAIDRENILNAQYNYPILAYLQQFLTDHPQDLEQPIIKAYHYILKFIQGENEDYYFFELKQYFTENLHHYTQTDQRTIAGFLLNYSSRRIKQGDKSFLLEKYQIYVLGIDNKIWTTGIYFSKLQFLQIVRTALDLNKFAWAADFIDQHGLSLPPSEQEYIMLYANTLLLFEKGDYSNALQLIPYEADDKDLFNQLDYKILSLKIYYKTSLSDPQHRQIKSIFKSIHNAINRDKKLPKGKRKMSERLSTSYLNFARLFAKILRRKDKLPENRSAESFTKLKQEIEQTTPLIERAWLLEELIDL